jgi:hypothetical protein
MNRRVGKIAIIDTPDTIITTKANLIKTADIYEIVNTSSEY